MSDLEQRPDREPVEPDFAYELTYGSSLDDETVELRISPDRDILHVFPGIGAAALKTLEIEYIDEDESEQEVIVTLYTRWMDIESAERIVKDTGIVPHIRKEIFTSEYEQYIDFRTKDFDFEDWTPEPVSSEMPE